jgi:uncharacterized protein YdaU (DUF1376 family)
LIDAPAPLTPADLDLSALEYMPLKIERLKRSAAWIKAKRNPELGFYLINIWTAAYMQKPAASLPDDDDLLCDAAMCEPRRWPKVKEIVMRGFILCADGRWYHQFVAELALEALEKRIKWRRKKQGQRGGSGGEQGDVHPQVHPPVPGDTQGDKGVSERYGTGRDGKVRKEDHTPSPESAREPVGNDLPEDQDGGGFVRPPSDHRSRGQRTPGDVLTNLLPKTGPPEKRLKRQDNADTEMANWLMTREGKNAEDAWRTVIIARNEDHPEQTDCARYLEKLSRKHRLGWFAEETV